MSLKCQVKILPYALRLTPYALRLTPYALRLKRLIQVIVEGKSTRIRKQLIPWPKL